jgi:hypothetical protein
MHTTPWLRTAVLLSLLLCVFALVSAPAAVAHDSRSTLKNFQHVFVIMMENTGFDTDWKPERSFHQRSGLQFRFGDELLWCDAP